MRGLALASVVAALSFVAAPAGADDGAPPAPTMRFVGDGCRVRDDAPVVCPTVASVTLVRGETASVQLLVETSSALAPADLVVTADAPLVVRSRREIFVPVRSRSHGVRPDEALPWSAAARPPDAEALGSVADPLTLDVAPASVTPRPGKRAAIWVDVETLPGAPAGHHRVDFELAGAHASLLASVIDADLPPIPVSTFAYVELDELKGLPDPDAARREIFALLRAHHVAPVTRIASIDDLARVAPLLDAFTVLGAYGTLGDPTPEAFATLERLVRALPERVTEVVLYAVDEDCASTAPAGWRALLDAAAEPAVRRVKVLATCGHLVAGADVTMVTSDVFRTGDAARARSAGRDVWVYNGRLPHGGPMALDAPPESLVWNGWIAAAYDVRRWFLWNTNHWTDRNRGGEGARDLYRDTETFHNADGDVVLGDGLLVYPAFQRAAFTSIGRPAPVDVEVDWAGREQILGSVRLAHLRRGAEDAALLALAFQADADLARSSLAAVVPRALGDVGAGSPTLLARAEEIAAARGRLHDAIARARREGRSPASQTDAEARETLRDLRVTTPHPPPPSPAAVVLLAAAALAAGALLTGAVERLRRPRARSSSAPAPPRP